VDFRKELPFPYLDNLTYSRDRDEVGRYYDYETSWGKFSYAPTIAACWFCAKARHRMTSCLNLS
jgi:hypothetical protein